MDLKEKYSIKHILTTQFNQDKLEGFFLQALILWRTQPLELYDTINY